MTAREEDHIKYFKFLNCWVDQPKFLDIVKAFWDRTVEGNNMWRFHQKLKRLSNTLSHCEYEERVRTAEEKLIQEHSDTNRSILHELNVEYIIFLKIEDSIFKQKTQLQWFKEGDRNTKYFHSLIRGRRRKLFIHKLIGGDGEWIEGYDLIAEAACDHFQEIFTGENKLINEGALEAKYHQRSNPISKKWDTGESLTWKHLMHNKHKVEDHKSNRLNNITVAEFWVGGQWNLNMLTQLAPSNYLADILSMKLYIQQDIPDQAI
ncbi:hypothetical protein H5410_030643 [Solanum commersonii]|uniref:Reverse transcriptase n=1 Tax=Solanum commersonii TaxID=4109 RepID=A0A9J5YGA7_SOLCO|nr:hypothetical protein H5410_030643 [Solanum commersonii]